MDDKQGRRIARELPENLKSIGKKETNKLFEDYYDDVKGKVASVKEYKEEYQRFLKAAKAGHKELIDYMSKNTEIVASFKKMNIEAKDLADNIEKSSNNTKKFKKGLDSALSSVNSLVGGFKDIYNKTLDIYKPLTEADQAAKDFGKHVGATYQKMEALRSSTIKFMSDQKLSLKYNASVKDMIALQEKFVSGLGRAVELTNEQKESMLAMRFVFGDETATQFTTNLEKFGINVSGAADRSSKIFQNATKHGIVAEKYSKNFLDNLRIAQNYSFTNGIEGLASMAEKATAINLNMQQVASVADKFGTLEGSLTGAASLSVLGGAFAQFGNPLSMLYESLNDMEGLQDRIVQMYSGMANWNSETGQIDISAWNKLMIKESAKAMGMSPDEALQLAFNSGRRRIVEENLKGSGWDKKLSSDLRELLLNTAQLDKNGNAYVSVNGASKYLSDSGVTFSTEDIRELKTLNQSEADNIRTIARDTQGLNEKIEGINRQIETDQADFLEPSIEIFRKGLDAIGQQTEMLAAIGLALKAINIVIPLISSIGSAIIQAIHMSNALGRSGGGLGTANGLLNVGKFAGGVGGSVVGALGGVGGAALGLTQIYGKLGDERNKYTDKEKTGMKVGGWAGALTGAAGGAAIGTLFGGPVGAVIGGLLGGVAGWAGSRGGAELGGAIGRNMTSPEEYRQQYPELRRFSNNYTTGELQDILKHTADAGLKKKMVSYGDYGKYESLAPKMGLGGVVHGRTHAQGGEMVELENGEQVIRASEAAKHRQLLNDINEGKGNLLNSMKVNNVRNGGSNGYGVSMPSDISVKPMNLTINGTIRLEGNGGYGSIDASKLINDRQFMNTLADMIQKEIFVRNHKGNPKDRYEGKKLGL